MSRHLWVTALVLASVHTLAWAAELGPEQSEAKSHGIVLYNQHKAISAEPYLKIAAEAGDREAQYYLGEAIRFNKRYMTEEAEKWYTAAANQGDYYAMYQLSGKGSDLCNAMGNCPAGTKTAGEWLLQGRETAKALADKGDAEAMYVLHFLTNKDEWLEKSVAAGYPKAQWYLATMYREGKGFFIFPGRRSDRIKELFKGSAEGGYPPAMLEYAGILRLEGNRDEGWRWIKKGAETGNAAIFSDYAYSYSDAENRWGTPVDYVKSYGLMSLLLELNGGGGMQVFVEGELPRIASHLTSEEIDEAKKIGADWKSTHPPLSFFPDKLGFW
ncbi:tetratricopeptide repeat protein [Pseudomonas sp. PDM22]|uniref:tetratricopeptide repeat protein n=1 Tax=Pseudomonas sp. PDM22 TaxID=2769287 RepID=UPI001CE089C8|nr:sel1 repeat family protein [Pseudomonas sp. PDM22]